MCGVMGRIVALLTVCYIMGLIKMKLTQKQEKFCRLVVELNNNSEAYRGAYNATKMKPETVTKRAGELIKNGAVSGLIAELREEHRQRHRVTVDDLLGELEEARKIALGSIIPQASAAVSATLGKSKLLGLDKQLIEVSGPGGKPIQIQEIPDEELEQKLRSLGLGRYHNQLGSKRVDE